MKKIKKKIMKRILSILLICTMVTGFVPSNSYAHAAEVTQNNENVAVKDTNTANFNATSDVGRMVADKIEEKTENESANDGHNIFSVEMNGKSASVNFETRSDAQLIVAIYNEAGDNMIAMGSTDVKAGDEKVTVNIDITAMPQYFYLRAFLIDPINGRPLCTKYETPNYTKEMQEFFEKDQSDFNEDKVLSLDDKDDKNFAVFSDDTTVITQKDSVNTVEKIDDEKGEYVFDNIDSSISELKKGDTFAYQYDDKETMVVNVGEISIDGNKATIIKSDDSIESAFEYVRYEMTASLDESNYDPSEAEKVGTFYGFKDMSESDIASLADCQADTTRSYGISFEFPLGGSTTGDNFKNTLKIEGKIDVTLKYYLSPTYQYVEYNESTVFGVKLQAKGKVPMVELPLGKVQIPVGGIGGIAFSPKFLVELEGTISCGGVLTHSTGYVISNKSGISDRSKSPTFKPEIKVEAKIYVGLKLDPKVYLLDKDVVSVGLECKAGIEASATMFNATGTGTVTHECQECISGEIYSKFSISIKATLFKKHEISYTPYETKNKICDFYYSMTHRQGGLTKCPYLRYNIAVTVKDGKGNPVSDAVVNDSFKTNSNGVAMLILPAGEQTIRASKGSYSASVMLCVGESATGVDIYIGGSDGSSGSDPGTSGGEEKKYRAMVSAGAQSSAVVTKDGELYTWGRNCIGDGSSQNRYSPVNITNSDVEGMLPSGEVAQVSIGYSHSAAVMKNGDLYMWGDNYYGEIGNGVTASSVKSPKLIMRNVKTVFCGYHVTAAVTEGGQLYTWGYARNGALGNGISSYESYPMPQKILDNIENVYVSKMSTYSEEYVSNMAAVDINGNLYVWGPGQDYQLGTGSTGNISTPKKIMTNIKSASIGAGHGAAVTRDGRLYMWGSNEYGQLGNGTKTTEQTPKLIAGNVDKVSLSGFVTMVLTKDENVYMSGGGKWDKFTRVLSDVQDISAGGYDSYNNYNYTIYYGWSAMALLEDGSVYTWGADNEYGQLGNGTTTASSTPQKISLVPDISELAASDEGAVAVLADVSASSGSSHSAAFSNLQPGEVYNFYSVRYRGADKPFAGSNVLYVDQFTADESGNISITYVPSAESLLSMDFVVAKEQKSLTDAAIETPDIIYNGGVRKVSPIVLYDKEQLTEGVDYEISGDLAGDIGEHKITITGKGLYTGTRELTYRVIMGDCSKLTIDEIPDAVYTGEAIEPQITVNDGKYRLVEGTDYTVSYQNNVNAGYGIAVIKGKNSYTGKYVSLFNIVAKQLDESATVEAESREYTGKPLTTDIAVTVDGKPLVYGLDFETEYTDNQNAGTAKVTITGKGNYTGSIESTFTITKDHKNTVLKGKKAATCTTPGYTGDTYCKDCGKKLKTGKSVAKKSHSYKWIVDKKATSAAMGSRHGECTKCGAKSKSQKYLASVTVQVQPCTGGVAVSWNKIASATSYDVYRADDSGNYRRIKTVQSGTKYVDRGANANGRKYSYYIIACKKSGNTKYVSDKSRTAITYYIRQSAVTVRKKTKTSCTVSWTGNTQVSGYQIQYSTNAKFDKNNKTINVDGSRKTSCTINSLKTGTVYYVRVRGLKKSGKIVYYSDWKTGKISN